MIEYFIIFGFGIVTGIVMGVLMVDWFLRQKGFYISHYIRPDILEKTDISGKLLK